MGLMAFNGIAIAYILRNCLGMAIVDMIRDAPKIEKCNLSAVEVVDDACPNLKREVHAVEKTVSGKTKFYF